MTGPRSTYVNAAGFEVLDPDDLASVVDAATVNAIFAS